MIKWGGRVLRLFLLPLPDVFYFRALRIKLSLQRVTAQSHFRRCRQLLCCGCAVGMGSVGLSFHLCILRTGLLQFCVKAFHFAL